MRFARGHSLLRTHSLPRTLPVPSALLRTMSFSASSSSPALNQATLKKLREYWFQGLPAKLSDDDEAAKKCFQRWFMGGKEVDDVCRSAFSTLNRKLKVRLQSMAIQTGLPSSARGELRLLCSGSHGPLHGQLIVRQWQPFQE